MNLKIIKSTLNRDELEKEKTRYIEMWRDANHQKFFHEKPGIMVSLLPVIVMACTGFFTIGMLLKKWHEVGLSIVLAVLMAVVVCILERKRATKREKALDTAFAAESILIPAIKMVLEYLDFQEYVSASVEAGKPAVVYEGRWLQTREEIITYMEYQFDFPSEVSQLWDGEPDTIDFSSYDEHIQTSLLRAKEWLHDN